MTKLFKQQASYLRHDNRNYTSELIRIEAPDAPEAAIAAWRSNRYLVQLFDHEGTSRLTINRTMVDEVKGGWIDGITWDEIQTIKRAVGYGDHYAVEVYPADNDVVNVANMRHIWLVDKPQFAWSKK